MSRPRTAVLTLGDQSEEVTGDSLSALRIEILNALVGAGIDCVSIEGIVFHNQKHWFIVFQTLDQRNKALGTTVEINKGKYVLQHPDKPKRAPLKRVRIFRYPLESETSVLEKAMAVYGTVSHTKELKDEALDIKTGVRIVAFEKITRDIPSCTLGNSKYDALMTASQRPVATARKLVTSRGTAKLAEYAKNAATPITRKTVAPIAHAITVRREGT
jgi:hypothetical protein